MAAKDGGQPGFTVHSNNYETNAPAITFRILIREGVLGYVFWSIYQAVAPMIWFYPLNELEITGYEAFALFKVSPLLLGIGPLRRLVQSRWVLAVVRLLAVACLASFQAETTLQRLVILCVGCFAIMWVLTVTLWSSSGYQRTVTFWGLMLGLFAFIVSRIWLVSFVPTWWSNTSNSIVIAIGMIATLDKIVSGEDALQVVANAQKDARVKRPNWLLTGLGYGGLVYITHAIFGEVSLLSRWVVKGYPNTGPMPHPWGAAVLFALYLGISVSTSSLVLHPVWWIFGLAALTGLYYLETWQAFIAGLCLAVFVMSIWPAMVDRLTLCPPTRTLVLATIVHIIQLLFNVWTVAYNFVPGGEYTREHTDWLLGFVGIIIMLALFQGRAVDEQKSHTVSVEVNRHKLPNIEVKILFVLLLMGGLSGFVYRYHPEKPLHPAKEHPKADFTAAIWTYHFGYDNRGWPSLERSAHLLQETGADIITLLESDASKPFLGNNDLGMWLGERLGMYVDFGPSTKDHTWGNLILSKYPFVKSRHLLLPSPYGELAPAVVATVNMTGHLVDLVVTHMGNDRDVYDREMQAKVLSEELRNAENPVVFLGYVTSAPQSRDYKQLISQGNMKDIDNTDDQRWCEYIMYRGLVRLGYARVSHGGLSDTELQMARFRFPLDQNNYQDHFKTVTNPSKVDPDVKAHFSKKFGEYKVGHNYVATEHRYHMSTPKYFVQK